MSLFSCELPNVLCYGVGVNVRVEVGVAVTTTGVCVIMIGVIVAWNTVAVMINGVCVFGTGVNVGVKVGVRVNGGGGACTVGRFPHGPFRATTFAATHTCLVPSIAAYH